MSEIDDIARPEPSAVLESLRSIGYSISTAIADLLALLQKISKSLSCEQLFGSRPR